MIGPSGERLTLEQFIVGASLKEQISTVQSTQISERLDAEHFQPATLAIENTIKRQKWKTLGEIATYIKRGMQPKYSDNGIPVLRTVNIRESGFSETRQLYVSLDFYADNPRGHVNYKDILITSTGVGTLGRVTYNSNKTPFFCDGHITIVRDLQVSHPIVVATFLQTKLGLALIERRQRGSSGQIEIYPSDISSIPIPLFKDSFEQEIIEMYETSKKLTIQSDQLYAEAEALLLTALGLDGLDLSPQLSYIAMFDEVEAAERLNAEYYHPEKQNVLKALAKLSGKPVSFHFDPIYDIVDPKKETIPHKVYNYDLTHALRYFLDDDVDTTLTSNLGSNKKRFQTDDIVVSRLRSYLKEIAIVATPSHTSCVGSSEFFVYRPKSGEITPELLLVFLRSEPVQNILKWCQTGSNHPRFDEKEILTLKIPDRILDVQSEVTRLIQQGITSHREAKQLLETAKQRIEQMILGG